MLEHRHSPKTDPELLGRTPQRVITAKALDDTLHRNWNLLKSTRQHVQTLLERFPDSNIAVVLFDDDGCVLDIIGTSTQMDWVSRQGFRLGFVFPDPEAILKQCGPIEVDGQRVAWLAILRKDERRLNAMAPLVHSACIAIGHAMKLEELRQDAMRVHHSLIGHLDCHVILLDADDKVIEERHPIPLSDDVRARMLRITTHDECYNEEISMGGRTYTADARKLWDHAGRIKGKLGIFRDITRNKTLELKIQDVEKLSILTSLAAGIAHEIRNPLTTARGFLQLFTERLDSAEDQRFLTLTIGELDRIQRLVTDFMSLAKPVTPHYEAVDVVQVIREVADFMLPEAILQGVSFNTTVPDKTMWVKADVHQIKQVILNVVQNAIQACTPKDHVKIEVCEHDTRARLFVKDTGCGMSEPELARIYQPYFTTKSTGTGLGLAVSKRIIHEHGGSISITSARGHGTTVEIEFPLFIAK